MHYYKENPLNLPYMSCALFDPPKMGPILKFNDPAKKSLEDNPLKHHNKSGVNMAPESRPLEK